ncbi:MAG: enoyl-CoA hydratase/isomerase family protein [Proteobacteria bacterium]|nr:enoyl-CoA hydratase/isomerase family protein [Pseudomonadota bacterium]
MAYDNYKFLKVRRDRGVAFVTIDNPPINLMTMELSAELAALSFEISMDNEVLVVVFDSADPDFFIAHYDVSVLALFPETPPPKPSDLHELHKTLEAFRRMPKVSIAKIEGRARGGGSEFCLGLDMRFGAIGKAILGQPEVGIGIIPGGGGTQRLPRLIGSARALEAIVGCGDFSAEEAERYGYINRALPPEELTAFVEDLAFRIATFQPEAIAAAKKAVQAATDLPLMEGLLEESYLFGQTTALPETKRRMNRFLELGGQTREVELDLSKLVSSLSEGG